MRLLLIRHGQSEGNAAGVVQGRLDFGLSELGRAQAAATAARLAGAHIDRILSSPLRRAMETAEQIAEPHGLLVESEPGLMEYDIGEVSGLTGAEIRRRYPQVTAAFARGQRPRFPGEEGRDHFSARIGKVLEELQASDKTVIAVGHGGVVNALCSLVLGIDRGRPGVFTVANCSITELFTDRSGRVVLQRQNDTCHLGELLTVVDRG